MRMRSKPCSSTTAKLRMRWCCRIYTEGQEGRRRMALVADLRCLPDDLHDRTYYEPANEGVEHHVRERMP